MTDLQSTATAYAAMIMRGIHSDVFCREDMYQAIRDAYEQGWVDCDTEDMKTENKSEFLITSKNELE